MIRIEDLVITKACLTDIGEQLEKQQLPEAEMYFMMADNIMDIITAYHLQNIEEKLDGASVGAIEDDASRGISRG